MAKTSKNILDEARAQIKSIDIDEARRMLQKPGTVLLDVREGDEWRQGHIPQAVGIPRGFLELRVEEKVPDHMTPVILQCASGTRSLLAARSLRELGYENVYNLTGGFNAWKDRGLPWVADRQFTPDELTRYSRHFVIPEVGEKGQAKLLDAKVLLLGAGALGSSSSLYLAAAGVGTLGLVDFDVVDLSNLQRQIIHTTDRVGMLKTESAEKSIKAINPGVKVNRHEVRLTSDNVMDIIKDYDVVVNCGDNFPTRYLINDACVLAHKPLVDGAIFRFEGNATVFYPAKGGPCYRCLYPEPAPPDMAPSCAEAGVLGALPGIIGSIEALEAIKLILGAGEPLIGRMVYFDTLSKDYVRVLKIKRDPKCPVCSDHPTQTGLIDYEAFCGLTAAPSAGAAAANGHAEAAPAAGR
ncbi:MAG TPA: molybdopterin-synthase adenylyltransferase MoeB [Candidatus Binataceae bacterium]|jgi:molybdopterin/thiamine biosynthesis adenylyltransferase/rhodanese-related sulfurtransferase|nr:molybdopterin-synthase adenylyltransferase MoeB [Candidatus Binataceae bacterium]